MTQSRSRVHRGYRSQKVVADWFRDHGWSYAEPTGAGRVGVDVLGMPGWACEVKARHGFNMTGYLKQATSERRHGLPFVVIRPDGYGEKRIGEWGVLLTLEDFTTLMQAMEFEQDES